MAPGLEGINWLAPWLAPYQELGQRIAHLTDAGQTCAQSLNAQNACPVAFVPQSDLPAGVAYEEFIFNTGKVPTRDGLHDFFNGLCWMHFPQTKQRLNQLQAAQIALTGIQPVRGPQPRIQGTVPLPENPSEESFEGQAGAGGCSLQAVKGNVYPGKRKPPL